MADILELSATFVVGLGIGIITTYVGHWLSGKRLKKEQFSPYLRKLHGIISRIMTKTEAKQLNSRFHALQNAMIEEEMRKSAMEKLSIEPSNVFESFGSSFGAYFFFISSFDSLVETIRECKNFESVYSEIEKKGILSTLELRDKRLYTYLSWFHDSASYIVKKTKDIFDQLRTTNEAIDQSESGTMSQSQAFQRIRMINTHDLFHWGEWLEKRLRKYL